MRHCAVQLNNNISKPKVLEQVVKDIIQAPSDVNRILVFSAETVDKVIYEERWHGVQFTSTETGQSFQSMSSGEQKIAVLNHFLKQKPNVIILDDWKSNIDIANSELLYQMLKKASDFTLFIQIFYHPKDVLPFITEIFFINSNQIFEKKTLASLLEKGNCDTSYKISKIPKPTHSAYSIHDPLIQFINVSVKYGKRQVLDSINWTIKKGEFWQLKGPNGSGKTTLVSMIIGDNPKAFGQDILLFGHKKGSGESVWDIKKNIGYFYPAMTLFFSRNDSIENMLISGLNDSIGLYQKPTESQQILAKEWLNILGNDYQNKRFNDLTEGQKRIVLVIRAVIKYPPLLILDEPTIGLDETNSSLFISLINDLAATKEIAIIYISHQAEQLLKADKVIELIKGENGSVGVLNIAE